MPTVKRDMVHRLGEEQLAIGRAIQAAIFAKDTESIYSSLEPVWPASSSYATSTEYFKTLVELEALNVGPNFFAAPGVAAWKGAMEDLPGESVAWCIVSDVDDSTPENLPVIFTRNANVQTLADFAKPVDEWWTNEKPFGKEAFVFITKSGAGFSLVDRKVAEIAFPDLAGLTNKVLRP